MENLIPFEIAERFSLYHEILSVSRVFELCRGFEKGKKRMGRG